MSWIKNLCETYEACKDVVGISGENQATMLLPLGHRLTEPDVIVYLNDEGAFMRAEQAPRKDKILICTPCTDESESRSSSSAIDFPHPLFDQIKYLSTQKYRDNLKAWLDFLEMKAEHRLAHQALRAVYRYSLSESLKKDLSSCELPVKDTWFVAYCVNLADSPEYRLWRMPELWRAWQDYFMAANIANRKSQDICYITANNLTYTEKHPKTINRLSANAKLISGNDDQNFTFRGRFVKPSEAVTVSYEASQKAHQTLRWLLSKRSSYHCGSQAIIAWAIDHNPDVPSFYDDSYGVYNNIRQSDEEKLVFADNQLYIDYSMSIKKALSGYKTTHELVSHGRRIALMSVDASTKGRMSVTYYRELAENEYEERIEQWHNTCKWYQLYGSKKDGINTSGYFIGAPSLSRIERAVLGKPGKEDQTYTKLAKMLREQLLCCIFDGNRIPLSLVKAASNRASAPISLENTAAKNAYDRWRDWEIVLCAACALVRKYYYDYKKEEFAVKLETERCDRDYLYGRLLAVADRIESLARFKQGKTKCDARATNAVRYMTAFAQHPFRTWNMLFTQQLNPYIQQLNGANWYLNLIGVIKERFEPSAFECDAPLDGRYLLGFFAQRQDFIERAQTKKGGESNDPEKQD